MHTSKLKNCTREEKFDVVHVHTPVASFITRLALETRSNKNDIVFVMDFIFIKVRH